jgi:hypothetical protein
MKSTNTTRLVMLTGDGHQCVVYEGRWALAAFNVNRTLEPALLERLRIAAHDSHQRVPAPSLAGRARTGS